jgi:hypothetical protein
MNTLHENALRVIEAYGNLHIGNVVVPTPYMNNRRLGLRGALAVLVGKGTPSDIEQEALIFALKERIDLNSLTEEQARMFLVNHHLGIDCSGYAYHILDAEVKEKTNSSLRKSIHLPFVKNPLKRLFSRLQLVKHIGVKTLAHDSNSKRVSLNDIQAGDMLVFLEVNNDTDHHHLLLVEKIEITNGQTVIFYIHTMQWQADGNYRHGVKHGSIRVDKPEEPLLAQTWEEAGFIGETNETFTHAKGARITDIRRLHTL